MIARQRLNFYQLRKNRMKTAELKYRALDWAVAKAKGKTVFISKQGKLMTSNYGDFNPRQGAPWWCPSTNWAQGGVIIEREGMALNMEDTHEWRAAMWWDDEDSKGDILMVGPTPLIAAMRCYVASVVGAEIDVPVELTKGELNNENT
jgi:hypothetical protein